MVNLTYGRPKSTHYVIAVMWAVCLVLYFRLQMWTGAKTHFLFYFHSKVRHDNDMTIYQHDNIPASVLFVLLEEFYSVFRSLECLE